MSTKFAYTFAVIVAVAAGVALFTSRAEPAEYKPEDANKDGCSTVQEMKDYAEMKLPGGVWEEYDGKVEENLIKTFLAMGAPPASKEVVSYTINGGVYVGVLDDKGCSLGGTSMPEFIFQAHLNDAKNGI